MLCPGCQLAPFLLRPVLQPCWRRPAPTRLSKACFAASQKPYGRIPSAPGLTEICTRIQQEYFEVGIIRVPPAQSMLIKAPFMGKKYKQLSTTNCLEEGVCCLVRWRVLQAHLSSTHAFVGLARAVGINTTALHAVVPAKRGAASSRSAGGARAGGLPGQCPRH